MKKKEFRENVREHISLLMKRKNISQVALLNRCKEEGFSISQPELSKLLSGKTPVTLYQMTAFARAFGVSVDELIYGSEHHEIFRLKGKNFVTNPGDEAYKGYLGTYYTMTKATSSAEEKWLFGKLTFETTEEREPICRARFELDTGNRDYKGRKISKEYEGQLIISKKLHVGYCILINEMIGEISCIEFRNRNFILGQLECRIGLALTTTAGEEKIPVVEKIFLSRCPFSQEYFSIMAPLMKFVDEDVLIAKKDLEEIQNRFSSCRIDTGALGNIKEYEVLDEQLLRKKYKELDRKEWTLFLSMIREKALAPYLLSLNEREDSLSYDIEQTMARKQNS